MTLHTLMPTFGPTLFSKTLRRPHQTKKIIESQDWLRPTKGGPVQPTSMTCPPPIETLTSQHALVHALTCFLLIPEHANASQPYRRLRRKRLEAWAAKSTSTASRTDSPGVGSSQPVSTATGKAAGVLCSTVVLVVHLRFGKGTASHPVSVATGKASGVFCATVIFVVSLRFGKARARDIVNPGLAAAKDRERKRHNLLG